MKKRFILFVIPAFFLTTLLHSYSFFNKPVTKEKMSLLPIPKDFRNYFLFQSFNDTSYIIIGDFTGEKRFVSKIIDEKSDNKITSVLEYYPDSGKMRIKLKPSSAFFKDLEKMKREIISGTIFRENYSYKMKSIDTLKYKLEDGTDIFSYGNGYSVKFFDPDEPKTIMSEFFFSKVGDRYDLVFKTNYYKLYRLKIIPPIKYSVYCKNSKDPVVAEIVESLLKMVPRNK